MEYHIYYDAARQKLHEDIAEAMSLLRRANDPNNAEHLDAISSRYRKLVKDLQGRLKVDSDLALFEDVRLSLTKKNDLVNSLCFEELREDVLARILNEDVSNPSLNLNFVPPANIYHQLLRLEPTVMNSPLQTQRELSYKAWVEGSDLCFHKMSLFSHIESPDKSTFVYTHLVDSASSERYVEHLANLAINPELREREFWELVRKSTSKPDKGISQLHQAAVRLTPGNVVLHMRNNFLVRAYLNGLEDTISGKFGAHDTTLNFSISTLIATINNVGLTNAPVGTTKHLLSMAGTSYVGLQRYFTAINKILSANSGQFYYSIGGKHFDEHSDTNAMFPATNRGRRDMQRSETIKLINNVLEKDMSKCPTHLRERLTITQGNARMLKDMLIGKGYCVAGDFLNDPPSGIKAEVGMEC